LRTRVIGRRYAKALFEIDEKNNSYEVTYRDLIAISNIISDYGEIYEFLKNPFFDKKKRKETFSQIASILDLSNIIKNLINLLIDNNRIGYLKDIIDAYMKFFDESRGILRATVIAPKKLEDSDIERIKEGLENHFNKSIKVSVKEDPSIIGGIIAKIGNVIIDGSIKSQLIHMREELTRG
jgi:F-type H+-transporting ATPase subunit delta